VWVVPIALAILGCASNHSSTQPSAQQPTAAAVVTMHLHSFDPQIVTVRVGQTVRWDNKSFIWHTVTDDPAEAKKPEDAALPPGADAFDSGKVAAGDSYSRTFSVPGTYKYFCRPHESYGMTGQVVVQP
jgi:plastocyanin